MRLIGIMLERWCSSSRASCSVATPGGRSRSSCLNAIRARCSTTASTRSRAGLREIAEAGAGGVLVGYSLGGRLALRAALRSPGSFSAVVTVGATAGIEEGPLRVARAEADEKLASWIEAAPIEDVVALWERQPLFADQSDAARRGPALRPAVAGPALARPAAAHRRPGRARAGLARAALVRATAAGDRRGARRRLHARGEAHRVDRAERPLGHRGGSGACAAAAAAG